MRITEYLVVVLIVMVANLSITLAFTRGELRREALTLNYRRYSQQFQSIPNPLIMSDHERVETLPSVDSPVKSNVKEVAAKLMGYVMGVGAMILYTPILIKLLKNGNADGFSLATWFYNLIGFALAIAYPMKKGFPISTYAEIIGAGIQSIGILGLICYYESKVLEFSIGLTIVLTSFFLFQKSSVFSPKSLGLVQILASLIANYANIPQIILTFQTKKASWSGITAFLSMAGCLIRIFTTLQLTKDPFLVAGYALGVLTNGMLLAQVLLYR